MTVQLEDRLTDLFDRVAAVVHVDEELDVVELERRRSPRRRRGWIAGIAAAVVLVAGTVALARATGGDPTGTVGQQPDEPTGPLYLLPDSLEGWEVSNGWVDSVETPRSLPTIRGVVVGLPADDAIVDPVNVRLVTDPPDGFVADTWTTLSIEGGPAYISPLDEERIDTIVAQQRGDIWLTSTSYDRVTSSIVRAFEALQISAEGTLELRPGSRMEIVDEYDLSPGLVHSTFHEVHSAEGEYLTVETVTNVDPSSAIGVDIERLEPVSVNGVTGWHTSRTDVDGEWNGIIWSPSPNQAAFVSGHEPFATVFEVAEGLVIVDAETWVDETGCANCADAEPDPDPPGAR